MSITCSGRISIRYFQDRTPGEPFVAKSAKEAEMEKLMKSMEVRKALKNY